MTNLLRNIGRSTFQISFYTIELNKNITFGFIIFACLSIVAFLYLSSLKKDSEIVYDYSDYIIEIEKFDCSEPCPTYSISISNEGVVKLQGYTLIDERFIDHSFSISKETSDSFLRALEDSNFIKEIDTVNQTEKRDLYAQIQVTTHGKQYKYAVSNQLGSEFSTTMKLQVDSILKKLDINQFFDKKKYDSEE